MPIANKPAGGGSQPSAATARLSSSASGLANGATIPFDTALVDTDGYFNSVTHKFTIPVGKGGLFLAGLTFSSNDPTDATRISANIANSGPDVNADSAAPVIGDPSACVSTLFQLADGDALTARVLHNGTTPIGLSTSNGTFWLVKVT